MAKRYTVAGIVALALIMPIWVMADSIEGRLNGLDCASKGEVCPTDKEDPHVLLERDFVVQTEDGHYYFITNMDWRTKLQHVLSMVRVIGQRSEKLMAMSADEFWVKQGSGEYTLAWSLSKAREAERLRQMQRQKQSEHQQ